MRKYKGKWLLFMPYLLIGILPLIIFLFKGLYEILNVNSDVLFSLMDMRTFVLLLKTVFYSVSVALCVVLMASIVALGLVATDQHKRKFFLWFLIVFIPLPVAIHTMMWMHILSVMNAVMNTSIPLTGWGVSIFVQSVAWLPLAIFIIYDAMMKIPKDLTEVGRFFSTDQKVFFKIWLPQCKTGITTAAIVVFLLTFNDYSVPSTFAVTTFAMEIFARYSISMNAGDAFMTALPMIGIGLALAFPLINNISQQFISNPGKRNDDFIKTLSFAKKYISKFTVFFILIITLFPLMMLIYGSRFYEFNLMNDGGKEIVMSLWIAFGATFMALPVMLSAAISVYKSQQWQTLTFLLILLPTLISPALIGAALIHLMNRPLLRGIYLSSIMGMLAVMIRFMPIGILVIVAGLRKIPEDMISVAYIASGSIRKSFEKIILPLAMPSVLIAIGLVFLLGIGELGTTVMVLPAGLSTITVRLYGYMHYGATELIAEISLVLVMVLLFFEWILYKAVRQWQKNLRKGGAYDSGE